MIDLSQIKTPVVEVKLTDGEIRHYDPVEVARAIEEKVSEGSTLTETVKTARSILALSVEQVPKDSTIVYLMQKMVEQVGDIVRGKGQSPAQRS